MTIYNTLVYCVMICAAISIFPVHTLLAILTIIALEIVFIEDPYERAQALRRKR